MAGCTSCGRESRVQRASILTHSAPPGCAAAPVLGSALRRVARRPCHGAASQRAPPRAPPTPACQSQPHSRPPPLPTCAPARPARYPSQAARCAQLVQRLLTCLPVWRLQLRNLDSSSLFSPASHCRPPPINHLSLLYILPSAPYAPSRPPAPPSRPPSRRIAAAAVDPPSPLSIFVPRPPTDAPLVHPSMKERPYPSPCCALAHISHARTLDATCVPPPPLLPSPLTSPFSNL